MNNGLLGFPTGGQSRLNATRRPRFGATLDRYHPLSAGLLGAWLFNEPTGTTLTNLGSTGSTYNGVLSGSTSRTIDENGDIVTSFASGGIGTITGFGNVAPTDEVTYVLSFYANAATDQAIFSLNNSSGTNRQTGTLAHSSLNIFWDNGSTTGGRLQTTPSPVVAGTWSNWAVVSSASIPAMYIYRNGALIASTSAREAFTQTNAALLIASGSINTFVGRFRYLYAYNRTLAAHEVAALNTNPYQHFFDAA